MKLRRREILTHGFGLTAGSVSASCIQRLDDDQHGNEPTVTTGGDPAPVIRSVSRPEPKIQDTNTIDVESGTEFQAELQNEAEPGKIAVVLYWVYEFDDGAPADFELVESISAELSTGSLTTVATTQEPPEDIKGYWFETFAVSVAPTVFNNGGPGDVSVVLREGGEPTDREHVELAAQETTTVTLSRSARSFGLEESAPWSLVASAA